MDPATTSPAPPEDLQQRTLYVLHLLDSCDQGLIESLFEKEHIESMQFLERDPSLRGLTVQVLFNSAEEAREALQLDGFDIQDDEDEKTEIRVMTPDQFTTYKEKQIVEAKKAEEPAIEAVPVSDDEEEGGGGMVAGGGVEEKAQEASGAAAEAVSEAPLPPEEIIDEASIGARISQYMITNKINWAEINNVLEMWEICDAISAEHSGLPDSLLKEAFLLVLQGSIHMTQSAWTRQHLDLLLREWKREVQSTKPSRRPTKFVASTTTTQQQEEEEEGLASTSVDAAPLSATASTATSANDGRAEKNRRKANNRRKRALKGLMSVGVVLQQARQKFCTEDGELEVEEDQYGNFAIGGQELSFDMWGELNRIRDADVVHANIVPTGTKRKRAGRAPKAQQQQVTKRAKATIAIDGGEEAPPSPAPTAPASTTLDATPAQPKEKKKQEKDEGELTESEDNSSASGSSTDDDDSDDDAPATGKGATARSHRRKKQQGQQQYSAARNKEMVSKFHAYRYEIAHSLSFPQKAAFLEMLETLQQQSGMMSAAQRGQMAQFMALITGSTTAST